MKTVALNIADYIIRIISEKPEIVLHPKFSSFISERTTESPDLTIRLIPGDLELPTDAECVFNAPYVEETDGILIQKSPEFWSVWKYKADLYIKTLLPFSGPGRSATLKFSRDSDHWELYTAATEVKADPLEYPLDGLILHYLTSIKGDIMIHASGVNYNGKGYLFTGMSGKGKSTMASIWQKTTGATVIHDDRLIIRHIRGRIRMHNSPVYNNDIPSSSNLARIYIIEHGSRNSVTKLKGAEAISAVMANCIQHNWNHELIAGTLESVTNLCGKIPVFKLSFRPENSIIDHILNHE